MSISEIKDQLNEAIINELIAENVNTYKSRSRIISDYRGEIGFTAAYNGRQLLELLQNADDAQTDKVFISIDTEKNVLSIANNGDPFYAEGLRSLMLANISSKNKREYIGNKGLGFRSILNWVISVKIKTQDFILEFSPVIARREFEKIIKSSEEREEIIRNEKDLPEGEIPFAILAIPDFKKNTKNQDFITIVELNYKESEERSILEQLETITPEVLLFLNHIHEIEIIGAGELDKKLILTEDPVKGKDRVSVNEFTWNIYNSGEKKLPNKNEAFYVYKIAWQDNLADIDACFSSYFPTKVATHLPYLIHATFDLDPSRNQLNKSDDNDYILSQIAESLSEIAENKLKNEAHPDWKAYQFLTVDGRSENRLLDSFFSKIETLKSEAAIYPTVGGKYKEKTDVIFYGNNFSEWVIRNEVEKFFENVLFPIPDFVKLQPNSFGKRYTKTGWQGIIANITDDISSIDERVNLIALLLDDPIKEILQGTNLPLLLGEKAKPVGADIEVFTLKQASLDGYGIPEHVNIAFLDDSLYEKLLERFAAEIDKIRTGNEDRSRPLKRLISPIVNLGSNDITDVIRNISRSFSDKINEDGVELTLEMQKFVNCLFNIFKKNSDRRGSLADTIYLVNRKLEKTKATDLFFGQEYPTGQSTEQIFEGIYTDNVYLAGNDFWELKSENDDIAFIEDFFIWLGVNKYTKFKTEIKDQISAWCDYSRFVFTTIGWPSNITTTNYRIKYVENFEQLISSENFMLEKLIAWIIKDSELFNSLDNARNSDTFESYYNRTTRTISYKPSYFKFQITQSKIADNLFVDFEFASLLGVKTINTNHELFKRLQINDIDIITVLRRLNAKMSFNDLEIERVYSLLDLQQTELTKARKIYQLAFNYFKNRPSTNFGSHIKQTNTLAVKNGIKEYRPTEEVYYSDNSTLPSKIIEDFWIFDFPKRSGEKQVAEYFGVKTFKDIAIEINDAIHTHQEGTNFNNWFNKIKPYILTYRLISISKESIEKTTVSNLKNVSIRLVSKLEYSIKAGGFKQLMPNEFINKTKLEYFICADSTLSLDQLKRIPPFCEAFAEILCVLFEVNENKDDFRSVFKDDFDLKDTKYLIQTKSLNEKFEDACRLLGLSVKELEFWRAIAKIKGQDWDESTSPSTLNTVVFDKFKYLLTQEYSSVHFDTFDNQQSFNFISNICNSLDLTLAEIKEHALGFPGLFKWHMCRIKDISFEIENLFASTIWNDLASKEISEQKHFLTRRDAFRIWFDKIPWAEAELPPFILKLVYKLIIKRKAESEFKIDLDDNADPIQTQSEYMEILAGHDEIEKSFTPEQKSLLFFEGHGIEIRKIIESFSLQDKTDDAIIGNQEESVLPIVESKFKNAIPKASHNGESHKAGKGVVSPKRDKEMRKAGKRAERKVRDALVEKYGRKNVQWISGNSDETNTNDTLGYDLRYRKIEIEEWCFLEVKSISGNSFIISNNELIVAFSNKMKYHLALVRADQIHIDTDFFNSHELEEEYKQINSSLSIKPVDYEIFIDIIKESPSEKVDLRCF